MKKTGRHCLLIWMADRLLSVGIFREKAVPGVYMWLAPILILIIMLCNCLENTLTESWNHHIRSWKKRIGSGGITFIRKVLFLYRIRESRIFIGYNYINWDRLPVRIGGLSIIQDLGWLWRNGLLHGGIWMCSFLIGQLILLIIWNFPALCPIRFLQEKRTWF